MFLFIFEGLGTSELMLILVVALVIFGPRKLPQLSRSIGKSLANFKRASEDFKETWEKEVARESAIKETLFGDPVLPGEDRSILGESRSRTQAVLEASENSSTSAEPVVVARTPSGASAESAPEAPVTTLDAPDLAPTRKRDWL